MISYMHNHIWFISVYLMLQYGNSDLHPVTVNVTQLLEDNVNAFKELYHKEKLENEKHKGELENLKLEINTVKEKSKSLAEGFEKLTTEKEIGDEKLKQAMQETDSLRKQLEEMKVIKEKELDEIRAKSNDEKNISIAKEKEYENLIKELQSKYEKTKEYNDILLRENSRMHSEKQELEDTHREGSQLKDKAIQDCSTLMIENDELRKKVNVVLCENRWLRGN